MEIAPRVHLIPGVIANCYLIVEPEGLTLIDAGLARSNGKILKYIAGLGCAPADLKRILITHADGDHTGALRALKTATGARVYSSAVEAESIRQGKSSRPLKGSPLQNIIFALIGPLFRTQPVDVDEYLADGQVLPVLDGLRAIHTIGHTPGHVSFFSPPTGILFVGDSLVSSRGTLRGSTGANTWDQAKANASVRAQAALGARIVCSGHGPVVTDASNKFPIP